MKRSNVPLVSGSTRRLASRTAIALASSLVLLSAPALASAGDKVLILQWPTSSLGSNAAGDAVNAELTALGYDVTLMNSAATVVPDTVSDYKQVYVVSLGLTPDTGAAKLVTYVQGGGHLYVTGDRPDPTNDLESQVMQEKVLKLVLKNSSALKVGTGTEGGNFPALGTDDITLVTEKIGVATHPNMLITDLNAAPPGPYMYMGDTGIIGGVPDDHVFAKDQNSHPVGAVWTSADLVQGTGCVMLVEDINWWNLWQEITPPAPPTHGQVSVVAANVADFMKYCGDHDLDGILDGDEPPLGTDPLNPDSDGDGLCDGAVAVDDPSITQKCIAGENAAAMQDTDGDGMIDALDPDDDNDGIPTKTEVTDVAMFGNPDTDNVPAWLDLDSDGDGVSDMMEGRKHFNDQGVPDYLDPNYPTPQPTSSSASGGGAGVTVGASATSATGSGSGGSGDGTDSGGCGCVVADSDETTGEHIALGGLLAGLAALWGRAKRRRAN